MVGNAPEGPINPAQMTPSESKIAPARLGERLAALPGIERLRAAAADLPAYLVGGAVRDLLLGRDRADMDVAVEGEVTELARRLGGEVRRHERFATATVLLDGLEVDLAATRSETYPRPGALPEVRPASLAADLARRDFTVNAMAVPLAGDPGADRSPWGPRGPAAGPAASPAPRLVRGRPHACPASRAIRGALRVHAGAGTRPSSAGARDLSTVSRDRRDAELRKLAAEPRGTPGVRAAGRVGPRWSWSPTPWSWLAAAGELTAAEPWRDVVPRADAVLAAALGRGVGEARELASAKPARPSEAVERARGRSGVELGARPGAGGRVARPIRHRVARGPARDRWQGPDRAGGPGGPGGRARPR